MIEHKKRIVELEKGSSDMKKTLYLALDNITKYEC